MAKVTFKTDLCKGCTHCIKRCPTEAIRVRDGHAVIDTERCIDCGVCIKVCPHGAKRAELDSLKDMDKFKHKIALPAPSLYAQFDNLDDIIKDIKQSDYLESNWQNYKSYNYYVGNLDWQDVLQTSCNILEKEIALFESAV